MSLAWWQDPDDRDDAKYDPPSTGLGHLITEEWSEALDESIRAYVALRERRAG